MSDIVTMKSLLEAGTHFGHKANVWNPKMSKYVFLKRNGIHIIDLQKTILLAERAYNYAKNTASATSNILFVGSKKQVKKIIAEQAQRCGAFYVNQRWIGGLLTNFNVVKKSMKKLKDYQDLLQDEEKKKQYTKKELFLIEKRAKKMNEFFGGILEMKKVPELIFVVDVYHEKNCVTEAKQMGVSTCGIVDTDSDPTLVDIPIPANDDAVRSVNLFVSYIAEAIIEGKKIRQKELENSPEFYQEKQKVEEENQENLQEEVAEENKLNSTEEATENTEE